MMKMKEVLLVLVLISLALGIDIAYEKAPDGFEFYTPTDVDDIYDDKLKKIVTKKEDSWELTLQKGDSTHPYGLYLFMNTSKPIEFVLDIGDNFVENFKSLIKFVLQQVPQDTKTNFSLSPASILNSPNIGINVQPNEGDFVGLGKLSGPKATNITIDHEGIIEATYDIKTDHKPVKVLSLNGTSGVFNTSISWQNLLQDFKIRIPSSVFCDLRPLPPPATTTTTAEDPTGSSNVSENSTEIFPPLDGYGNAEISWGVWVVIGVIFTFIVIGVIITAFCIIKKRRNSKGSDTSTTPRTALAASAISTARPTTQTQEPSSNATTPLITPHTLNEVESKKMPNAAPQYQPIPQNDPRASPVLPPPPPAPAGIHMAPRNSNSNQPEYEIIDTQPNFVPPPPPKDSPANQYEPLAPFIGQKQL